MINDDYTFHSAICNFFLYGLPGIWLNPIVSVSYQLLEREKKVKPISLFYCWSICFIYKLADVKLFLLRGCSFLVFITVIFYVLYLLTTSLVTTISDVQILVQTSECLYFSYVIRLIKSGLFFYFLCMLLEAFNRVDYWFIFLCHFPALFRLSL